MFAAGTDKHKVSCRIRILGRAEIPINNGTGTKEESVQASHLIHSRLGSAKKQATEA